MSRHVVLVKTGTEDEDIPTPNVASFEIPTGLREEIGMEVGGRALESTSRFIAEVKAGLSLGRTYGTRVMRLFELLTKGRQARA